MHFYHRGRMAIGRTPRGTVVTAMDANNAPKAFAAIAYLKPVIRRGQLLAGTRVQTVAVLRPTLYRCRSRRLCLP